MKKYTNIAFILIIAYLLFNRWQLTTEINQKTSVIEYLSDTLSTTRNDLGQSVAEISHLGVGKVKDFLAIESKDSAITKLQALASRYKKELDKSQGTAIYYSQETKIDTVVSTGISRSDTVYKDNKIYIYPEYHSKFNLKGWVTGFVLSNKDSSQVSLSIKNDQEIVIYQKKRDFVIEITSLNPYSELTNLRSFSVRKPKKRFVLGPSIGVGVNRDIKLAPIIGISLVYKLIEF